MAYRAAVCDDSAGKYYELWNAQAQYDTKEPAEKTGGSLHKIPTKKLYVPPKSGANCELFGRTA